MEKTHWRKVFLSDYLGSCDLDDGRDLKLKIKHVTVQEIKGTDGKKQDRNVATFTDAAIKPMILNATNCKVIKKFAKSAYIDDWTNIPIQVYIKDDIKAFGETVDGLRIRTVQPTFGKQILRPSNKAWPKAIEFLKGSGTMAKIREKYAVSQADEELLKEAVI